MRVWNRLTSMEQFRDAIFQTFTTRKLVSREVTLDEGGKASIQFEAGSSPFSREGVYPISFGTIAEDGTEIAGPVAFACVNPEVVPEVNVGTLLRMVVPPLPSPNATDRFDWSTPPAATVMNSLSSATSGDGYVLLIGGETLERWSQRNEPEAQQAFDQVVGIAGRAAILSDTYVPIDHAALLDNRLGTAIPDVAALGNDTVGAYIGPGSLLTGVEYVSSPSRAVLNEARRRGVRTVIVRESELKQNLPSRGTITTASGSVTALTINETLSPLWTTPINAGDQVLRARQLSAGVALASRLSDNPSSWILIDGGSTSPDPAFLEEWNATLSSMKGIVPISSVAFATSEQPPAEVALQDRPPGKPPITQERYLAAQRNLSTIGETVGEGDPLVARARRAIAHGVASGQALGATESAAEQYDHRGWLRSTSKQLAEAFQGIEVPTNTQLTLPSAQARVPITLRNTSEKPIPIRLRLSSPRLTFPDQRTWEWEGVLPPGGMTRNVPVTARAAGNTVIDVEVRSRDGNYLIQSQQIRVSANLVISRVALLVTALALAFLLLWWWSHRRKHRSAPHG